MTALLTPSLDTETRPELRIPAPSSGFAFPGVPFKITPVLEFQPGVSAQAAVGPPVEAPFP